MSCSHGAGRRMSRIQDLKTLLLEKGRKGIIHDMLKNGLDEASSANKNIEQVMALNTDLVKPQVKLAVVKGN